MNKLVEKGIAVMDKSSYDRDDVWVLDGFKLSEYEFYRAKDAFTAFQEITAWISGVLPSTRNVPQITDDRVNIEKQGFDYVTSFRKEKAGNK